MGKIWVDTATTKLSARTFEDVVAEGVMEKSEVVYHTIRSPPAIIYNACRFLRGKHKNMQSISAVQKYATLLGAAAVGTDGPTGTLIQRMSIRHMADPGMPHHLRYTPSVITSPRPMNICLFTKTRDILANLAVDLDIPMAVLCGTSFLYGVSRAELWLPKNYMEPVDKELDNFRTFIRQQSKLFA